MLENLQAIILAGGISERFQTGNTKLIEKICGTEMILFPVRLLKSLQIPTAIVVGFQHERIKKIVQANHPEVTFVLQKEPLGTGHATQLTKNIWNQDHILLMNADIPLLTADIINKLYRKHIKADADISFVTAHSMGLDATKYSRVSFDNNKIQVTEGPDNCDIDDSDQCCISAGIYIAKRSFLNQHIEKLSKNETTGEIYLPELIKIASDHQCKIITTPVSFDIVRSVDTLADLWAVEHIKRSQLMLHWMNHGVRFANTLNILIDETVHIEPRCYIGSGVLLLGKTTIKSDTTIGAYTHIENSTIEKECVIPSHMIITKSTIKKNTTLHSFSHIDNQKIQERNDLTFAGARKTIQTIQHQNF
ncbi:MAG TPA: NTP transferase domain-containing protein [Candidatus Saccharimonadales bacterium]|nr:NTP transferase domain-containing protein [Candidatus Saccharimonadales bacterium]